MTENSDESSEDEESTEELILWLSLQSINDVLLPLLCQLLRLFYLGFELFIVKR